MKLERVCQIIKITPKSVARARKRGDIKATRQPNGQYDYDHDSVMAYSNRGRNKTHGREAGTEPPKRFSVLYIRASNGSRKNIENQMFRLMKGVKRHCVENDLSLPKKGLKDYYSADEGQRRTAFRKLLRLVIKQRIDTVYVISFPRLFRGARIFLERSLSIDFAQNVVFI